MLTWLAWMLCLLAGMFVLRGIAPSDLLDNDQLKPAGYLMDIMADGRWLVQTDFPGNIASKPPLHTWLAAGAAFVLGTNELALAVPSLLGMFLGCVAIWMIAADTLGRRAAWVASLAWLFSFFGFKHVWLARTDALYAGLTALAIALAWRLCLGAPRCSGERVPDAVSHDGGGHGVFGSWVWVWLVLALATLTKGPLSILFFMFAAVGLALTKPRRWIRGGHAVGVVLLFGLSGGWFVAALLFGGQGVYDKLIGDELLGHAVGASKGHLREITIGERAWVFFLGLFKPTLYAIWNTVPWSVAWVIAVWRTLARPAREIAERRLELMCLAWLGLGVALLSIVPHQRADHLLPLIPAAAILAGREIERWIAGWSSERCRIGLVAVTAMAFILAWVNYGLIRQDAWYVRQQEALRTMAQEIVSRDDIDPGLIVFVDASPGLQFLLRNNGSRVAMEDAASRFAAGEAGVLAIQDAEGFLEHFMRAGGDPDRLMILAAVRSRGAAVGASGVADEGADDPSPLRDYRGALVILVGLADDDGAGNHEDDPAAGHDDGHGDGSESA